MSEIDDILHAEQAAKDAGYRAFPLRAIGSDGVELALGQHVDVACDSHSPDPVITELTIRCYGSTLDEADMRYSDTEHKFVEVGREPQQQVWVFVNGQNCIHRPEQIKQRA